MNTRLEHIKNLLDDAQCIMRHEADVLSEAEDAISAEHLHDAMANVAVARNGLDKIRE